MRIPKCRLLDTFSLYLLLRIDHSLKATLTSFLIIVRSHSLKALLINISTQSWYKVQKRKFASLTEFQRALIASLLCFEPLQPQNEFQLEELQIDLVSQLQQAKKAKRSYFQVHAFKLELSIFFHIFKGNLYIYDIADISKHGLELISDVYNLKALDSITMRKQLHCAQFIEASKFDSKLNQLVKQIWKAGYKFFYFSLSKESMQNLESSLMKHSNYADTDPIIGICFEKPNEQL